MAKQDHSAFKAGLFIVVTLILIAGIIVSIKGARAVFTKFVDRRVRFTLTDDIGGLRPGDDVRLGGYKVGVIEAIDIVGLTEGQQPGIVITFTVPEKYPLYANAHVAVQGTLTGSSWLNVNDLGSGAALPANAELPGHASVSTELINNLKGAAPELTGLLKDVRTVTLPKVNDKVDKIGDALASIKIFADRAAEMAVQVRDLFGDTKPDFRGTMSNLNAVTASAKLKLPGILENLNSAMVKAAGTLDSAKAAMEDIKTTAANTRDLTASAKGIIGGNRGKLDGIIASLKSTSDNLKSASSEIRHSPWRLLYTPGPGEIDNMELFDAARHFSDGANGVNDAAQALRDAMDDPNVDQDQVEKLLEKLGNTFANFHEVETKLWKAVRE